MGWTITYGHRLKPFLQERTAGWESKTPTGLVEKKTVCITYHYSMHNPGSGVLFKVMETQRMAPDGVTVVERDRWIGVDLVKFYGGRGRDEGWGYKDMEASMGPTAHGCPLLYVEELVPEPPPCAKFAFGTCNENQYEDSHKGCKKCHGCSRCWEREWRQRVRDYHAERRRQQTFMKSLKPGDVVVLKENWTYAGEPLTVSAVYPKTVTAGGVSVPRKAIDVGASLEAVGISREVAK